MTGGGPARPLPGSRPADDVLAVELSVPFARLLAAADIAAWAKLVREARPLPAADQPYIERFLMELPAGEVVAWATRHRLPDATIPALAATVLGPKWPALAPDLAEWAKEMGLPC